MYGIGYKRRITVWFVVLTFYASLVNAQQIEFLLPLAGEQGKDFWIGYYMDHNDGAGMQDGMCGEKTYNDHNGTDFMIRGFKAMDSGVNVQAIADGVVLGVRDGMYDRSKKWEGGNYGNYISILHSGNYIAYYAHLRKNSIQVRQGDSVKAGQIIAQVGSSGYSCYPHLHLELKKTGRLVDPFAGTCNGELNSYRINTPAYDTSLHLIDNGFASYVPGLDSLQERFEVRDTFYIKTDTTVCFWQLMHGLRRGDKTHIKWYTPKGKLWFCFDYEWKLNWWWDYSWFYIDMPEKQGVWKIASYVNDKLITTDSFYVQTRRDK